MFSSKLLTADPKEHLRRTKILLDKKDDSLLRYAALEMRLAIEIIIHNQLTLSDLHSIKAKKKNDPKRKKLIMNNIDLDSDNDYDIYYKDPEHGTRTYWGTYKNISTKTVNEIEGKLGNFLHMKLDLNLGKADDLWYKETRNFLNETCDYLTERLRNSEYFFSFQGLANFEMIKK